MINQEPIVRKDIERALLKYKDQEILLFKVLCGSIWIDHKTINNIDISGVKKIIIVFKNHNPSFIQSENYLPKYMKF